MTDNIFDLFITDISPVFEKLIDLVIDECKDFQRINEDGEVIILDNMRDILKQKFVQEKGKHIKKKKKYKRRSTAYTQFLADKEILIQLRIDYPDIEPKFLHKKKSELWRQLSDKDKVKYQIRADKINNDS